MKKITLILALMAGLSITSINANAALVGGINFAGNAFVDKVTGSSGNFLNYNSAIASDIISGAQLSSDLTDTGTNAASTYILSMDIDAYVDLAFTDNYAFNGAGNDLAFFFAGAANFNFSTGSSSTAYTSQKIDGYWVTDRFGSYELNIAQVNLDDLGFGTNETLSDFRILLGSGSAALSMIGALNSVNLNDLSSITLPPTAVPLPAPLLLLLSGLGVFGWFGRRKQQ